MFEVQLIQTDDIHSLTGLEVFSLCQNANHIAGNYWIYEGEIFALRLRNEPKVIKTGITEGIQGMGPIDLIAHCETIFDYSFDGEKRTWEILN